MTSAPADGDGTKHWWFPNVKDIWWWSPNTPMACEVVQIIDERYDANEEEWSYLLQPLQNMYGIAHGQSPSWNTISALMTQAVLLQSAEEAPGLWRFARENNLPIIVIEAIKKHWDSELPFHKV